MKEGYFKLDVEQYFSNYNKYDSADLSVVKDMFKLGCDIGVEVVRKQLKIDRSEFYKMVGLTDPRKRR